ncbi:hypothetical protein O181_002830 [Austropuccinia psidii MF-1]|uniref:Uncharacterized protein n=1 Tax=Austropuccinia psidii MF-1 TaxID=1389203 RepID=A0A9Q3BD77_9BASI|nr:hypothetical protein [Austropuccinia psidii MF-1]
MVSKANKETTSKEKTAATVLLAYVYELTERKRLDSPEKFIFTHKMMNDLAHQTESMFLPNHRRIWIEIKGEPPKASPKELDLKFLTDPKYNKLDAESRRRLNNFKELFDQAAKDDSGMKVDNQVKVLRDSLRALHQNAAEPNPEERKAWEEVYAQIMKEYKTKNGRSQYVQHLKLEAVMQYGLLGLPALAKEPLLDLQERLYKRLQLNGSNGWIEMFKFELEDTPWDMGE